MPDPIQSPEKELRFTRAGQAVPFWIAAAVLVAVSVTMLVSVFQRDFQFQFSQLWALVPLVLAWLAARLAIRMTRHAYLIFTPLGVEIFPLFKPEKSMRLVLWQEIHGAEVDPDLSRLTLHHDAEKTSGIHLSLSPIPRNRRVLLAKAISGRVSRA
ncbi:hypothetical protein OVA24_08625 [Luteolibacter sp. SL250]|uniref:hypothetical protein n=1 Tax=Luteolibacter sp. SL250 TaxID=2995170 RepID=UPI0022700982|nr:hypothetical protein [Luteolibacter sp. SL250]WAC21449.1 hypothetical protein OVA24_08625 [Luteolibacter sp. SL250]